MENNITPVVDGHVDLLYFLMGNDCIKNKKFTEIEHKLFSQKAFTSADVSFIVSAFYCPDQFNGQKTSSDFFLFLLDYYDRYIDGLVKITSADDIGRCCGSKKKTGVLFLLENADSLVDLGVDILKEYAFGAVGLTHVGKNRIGDGNSIRFADGLSRKGREIVKQIDAVDVAIDIAHLSDPCIKELANIFSGPVLSSHTGFRKFCDMPRNLSEDHMKFIVERSGMIGVSVSPEMLSSDKKAGCYDVFVHIDWFVQRFGHECIGIGSDFGGFNIPNTEIDSYAKLASLKTMFMEHGYPPSAVADIMGENWCRFYGKILS